MPHASLYQDSWRNPLSTARRHSSEALAAILLKVKKSTSVMTTTRKNKTHMKKILFCLMVLLLNSIIMRSQNELSGVISEKATGLKDSLYHDLQIGTLTYASISNNYVVKKYKKFLYILKIDDIRMKKYYKDIKKEVTDEFLKWKINSICLDDINKPNEKDQTTLNSIIEENGVDGLIIINFSSDQSHHSSGSMFFNMPHKSLSTTTIVDFYDKEYTKTPFIKVIAGADSHYFKPRALSEKAIANTLRGLINANLLKQNLVP
jgi:hypothetical protein